MRRGAILAVAAGLVAALAASGAAAGASPALPRACKLLTRDEAAAIVGVKVKPAEDGGSLCTYNGYPTGPAAQVTVFVSNGVPRTLTIDRSLHHQFRRVPRLGDAAYEEQWAVFARKGSTLVMISVVRLDDWTKYRAALERAAAIAIKRIGAGAGGSRSAPPKAPAPSSPAATANPQVIGHLPAGGGTNPRWRGSERRFGGSVGKLPGVVYEPNVVVIGGGAGAIRSESADGLTWTLAANAPGVQELRVGKIMLATSFASGRVLAVARDGATVRVTLGPASLTQIVRDGVFDSHGPVAIEQPLFYSTALPSTPPKRRTTQSVARVAGTGALFGTTPICCSGGVGVHLSYDNGEGRMAATLQLYLERPTVTYRIRIGGGKLLEARLDLHGAGGFRYDFFGATKNISGNVRSGPLLVPGSITIPLAGPISLQLTQRFAVSMQLSGAAWMHSSGDYRLAGTLGFGTAGGAQPDPVSMSVRKPLLEHTSSLGLGSNAFSIGWTLRATVGIGVGGFGVGAWYEFKPGLAVAMDGSPGSLKQGCVTAALAVEDRFGVGYSIPDYVASVVNAVLRAVGAKPIGTSGGPAWGPYPIWKPPSAEACPQKH